MFLKIAREIAKPQAFAILDLLKRSTGLSVREMAEALRMSYMGVKQHCIKLEKKGLLDTRRRPGGAGRPEKAYRLTPKADAFYPEAGNELTMDLLHAIQEIYGPSVPDKLFSNYFTRRTEDYLKKVKGQSTADRAASFARIRDEEGYCSGLEQVPDDRIQVVEFHHPLKELIGIYPNIRLMETQMVRKVLQSEVQRQEETSSGLTCVRWCLPG
ncbi:MAG: Transcriptional regulator ArsR family [Verrucomicrobiales bacterium]|nr:Transcriptional regulator ArsR family [Verrucomicrobiales bacterium]